MNHFMNVSSIKGAQIQADVTKKLQEDNVGAAEMFAGLMNQTMDFNNYIADGKKAGKSVVEVSKSTQSAADSYERYSYKEKQFRTAKESTVAEKIEENTETFEQAAEETLDVICEAYGVDEEKVKNLLEAMGLSALDLLNPQNLVSFLVELTGMESGEELLLDENFLQVMESLNSLAEGLQDELGVDTESLQDLIAQMDAVDEDLQISLQEVEDVAQGVLVDQNAEENAQMMGYNMEDSLTMKSVRTDGESENGAFTDTQPDLTIMIDSMNANVLPMDEAAQTSFSSYLSTESIQILEQIVQKMRVNLTADMTSMEMQLDPEHLGKVYVKISSEEGMIHAQFQATNEAVKEALEAQIATLRENLNQVGVKVDAIEVTIASHGFERNLEQNQKNAKDQAATEESKTSKRRNITMDSLDELSGLMTEEESLVAQIMKDNGNSVDFTA